MFERKHQIRKYTKCELHSVSKDLLKFNHILQAESHAIHRRRKCKVDIQVDKPSVHIIDLIIKAEDPFTDFLKSTLLTESANEDP